MKTDEEIIQGLIEVFNSILDEGLKKINANGSVGASEERV